jgi:hypothetical protein
MAAFLLYDDYADILGGTDYHKTLVGLLFCSFLYEFLLPNVSFQISRDSLNSEISRFRFLLVSSLFVCTLSIYQSA